MENPIKADSNHGEYGETVIGNGKVAIIVHHETDDACCESKIEEDKWDCTKKMKKGVKLVEMFRVEVEKCRNQIKSTPSYNYADADFGCFKHWVLAPWELILLEVFLLIGRS